MGALEKFRDLEAELQELGRRPRTAAERLPIATDAAAAAVEVLRILNDLRPKFAPMSPRVEKIYPSFTAEQCAFLDELLTDLRDEATADLAIAEGIAAMAIKAGAVQADADTEPPPPASADQMGLFGPGK